DIGNRRGARTDLAITFAADLPAVRRDLNLKDLRFLITGKGIKRKPTVGTAAGVGREFNMFINDGKVRPLNSPMPAASSLLTTRTGWGKLSLRFFGGLGRLTFYAKEAMPEITNPRLFLLKFLLEVRLSLAGSQMLGFPVTTFPFKSRQLFLSDRHEGENR